VHLQRWRASKVGGRPSSFETHRFRDAPQEDGDRLFENLIGAIHQTRHSGGKPQGEPGIHNHDREYGFRARARAPRKMDKW